jgi:hypothetical protein
MGGQTATVSADQYRTFTLLHELFHLVGFGEGPDANNYDNPFNKSILQDCVGVKFK